MTIVAGNIDVTAVDDQFCLPQQLLKAGFNFNQALAVLEALVVEDALDDFLLGDRNVLPNVFFGTFVHQQVTYQAFIFGQDHTQLIAPHALHALHGFVAGTLAEWRNDVDG